MQVLGEAACFQCKVGRTVVRQPLDRQLRQFRAKALLDGGQHNVADVIAGVAAGGGTPTQGLPIAAIQGEGGADSLTVVTPKLEAVGAPAPIAGIDGYAAIVTP